MSKYRGTIRKSDLEGGVWQLVADDGEIYEVEGSDPLLKKEGASVEVDGTVDKNAMSFSMTGPRIKVKSIKTV
jgi:hypothetical protein